MILLILLKQFFKLQRSVCVLLFFAVAGVCIPVYAQESNAVQLKGTGRVSTLTITYELQIASAKKRGHAESYNGSIKTIFIQDGKVRNRLVALMRIQSLFYFQSAIQGADTIISVKETGKDRIVNRFSNTEWDDLNRKYRNKRLAFFSDSILILNYTCYRAVVSLSDGKEITVFYTTAIQNEMLQLTEPAFAGIPGVVLQYTYQNKEATVVYKATNVTTDAIDPAVFQLPAAK
ncbi:hypothetical protein ESA94_11130 [Lacibacter luteus]|uniref:DUF3108 domain-containing protein n=1 Tax=Lacibacter luteus TaxID=2508719 RepID=A0A4Q1CH35_9BACT|nr:hypothetical protein [Lacibacter luteus]RXK59617.1 hypothetical protein ESA94_11130 [Lacibacter luteus]